MNTTLALAHLPDSMISAVSLIPNNKRLILFTRHSLRELSDGNGFASAQLPLTGKGQMLARSWGQWLSENLAYSLDIDSISSPIGRCVDTASLMQEGAGVSRMVEHQSLLVEPGSLVINAEIASPLFKQIGALNFINRFLQNDLEGTKSAYNGGVDILNLLYHYQPHVDELRLAVSHDTLLSAFLSVVMRVGQIDWDDWPKMMEGVFLWFDDQPNNKDEFIADSTVFHLIWRGEVFHSSVAEIKQHYLL